MERKGTAMAAAMAAMILGLGMATNVQADIQLSNPTITAEGSGNFLWTYTATLTTGETLSSAGGAPGQATGKNGSSSSLSADYFTIYDFAGYTGTHLQSNSSWNLETALVGSTPGSVVPVDNSGITNLTMYYTGVPVLSGPLPLGSFTFESTFGTPTIGNYVGDATTTTGNLDQENISNVNVPNPVPEPGTIMLLGAGFLGLAVYGKRRKNA